MAAICVKNLSKQYNLYNSKKDKLKEAFSIHNKKYHKNFDALHDINFSIEFGECVGIIGVNGSGKSTLLKILTGILMPTTGTVEVNGSVSALLELGAGFNPDYTGLENLYLNGMIMGYSKEEMKKKEKAILEFADIGDFIYQPVKLYSSGMFVRLAFAIAINVHPDILIIDEALSVGDVFFQQKCYRKIKEISNDATVLIVSHDVNMLTKLCKRIIVLHNGKMIFDGPSKEAVVEYLKTKQGSQIENVDNFPKVSTKEFARFRIPDKTVYSGNMNAVIERFYYDINGDEYAEYCQLGDMINVQLLVDVISPIEYPIIGFQVRDKYGNEIFGETSLTSNVAPFRLNQGKNLISLNFTWPEVREGDYFITLGIGNGMEVLKQIEECWLNNVIHIIAMTQGKVIFGIFNQPMLSCLVEMI